MFRVGGDAHIAPRPDRREWLVYADRRTALLSDLRDDEGIVPYANGKALPFNGAGMIVQGSPPHPPPAGGTLSKQERAGDVRRWYSEKWR